MNKETVIINGKEEEIFINIPIEEKEENSDLINLEDTIDLSEVIINE